MFINHILLTSDGANLSNQNIWYNLGETSHARVNDWILVYEGEMQHDAYYV